MTARESRSSPYGRMGVPTDTESSPSLNLVRRLGRVLLRLPRTWAWIPAALWMGLIWVLSSMGDAGPSLLFGAPDFWLDFAHAGAFGLLALWFCLLLPRAGGWVSAPFALRATVVLLTGLYGAVDEWHQSLVPGRHPTLLDLFTDVAGASCVVWIVTYAGRSTSTERGLRLRLLVALAACALVAGVSTTFHTFHPDPLWFS